jgi:hypothetical protein
MFRQRTRTALAGLVAGLVVGLVALLVNGCGAPVPKIVPAAGVVTLNGKPLPKARVRFCPDGVPGAGADFTAEGSTDEAGRFTLTCHGQPGAVSGENLVVILEAEIPPELTKTSARVQLTEYLEALPNRPIPTKYSSAAQSQIKVTVSAEQPSHTIVLSR